MESSFDIAVIGAGVIGCAIAEELANYEVSVCVIEQGPEPAVGTSKANSGIVHSGYDPLPGTLMAKLNVEGANRFPEWTRTLGVAYRRTGSLVIAQDEVELLKLAELLQRGRINGVSCLRLIDANELRLLEPRVSPRAKGALLAENAGVVSPYELTIALAETAADNGVQFFFDSAVMSVSNADRGLLVHTSKCETRAKLVINVAGVYADDIARMIGDCSFSIQAIKGEEIILDKEYGSLMSHILFPLPAEVSKGIIVAPTAHGNLLIGPTVEPTAKCDFATSRQGLEEVIRSAMNLVPSIPREGVITSYAGLRAAANTGDFIISYSPVSRRMINVAGIKSPGLAAAPAIARMVSSLVKEVLPLSRKNSIKQRRPFIRMAELSLDEQHALIQTNPAYGRIVCRCEQISEGEIRDLFRSSIPPRTLDGVKRRARAGMGRCQGGFCTPAVLRIMAEELGVPTTSVQKSSPGSKLAFESFVGGTLQEVNTLCTNNRSILLS